MSKQTIHTVFVDQVTSTNELAKELLKEKKQSFPFLVQTAFQTNGKGQYRKSWESIAGENLLLSIVLKAPPIAIEKQFDISKAIAVAIRRVIVRHTKAKVCIKWPNDIYVGDKKIAGILIENTIIGQKLDTCIIGIGLNVNQIQFNSHLPNPISLKQLTTSEHDIEVIKLQIVDEIFSRLKKLEDSGYEYDKYLYRKGELGKFVTKGKEEFLGVIIGVNEYGRLLIRIENNQIRSFDNNELQFILLEIN